MELFRALAVLAEPPERPEVARLAEVLGFGSPPAESEYTETFVFQLYPYASVYLSAEGMLGGEARDRVAGFWHALGLTPPPEPDHLTTLLAAYAQLAEREEREGEEARRAGWRGARKAFLWEHLLSWLPVYLDKLAEIAPPFYRRWGELLTGALLEEAAALGVQESLPLHLREAAGVIDPRNARVEDFLQSLLAPARSGMILVRADLSRAARTLGTGLRAGERRFALKSLFGQDARGTLSWLASEAGGWAERHERRASFGGVADWWTARALATASLLKELKTEAEETASLLE